MSSSEYPDVDLQFQRIIKPKKLITRLNRSPFLNQPSPPNLLLCPQKNRPKKVMNHSSAQDNSSNPYEAQRLANKLSMDLCLFIHRKKKITFDLDSQKEQKQTHANLSDIKNSDKSFNHSVKIKFSLQDSEREDQQGEFQQMFAEKTSKSQRVRRTNKTFKGAYRGLEKVSKIQYEPSRLKQKTTPIFSNNRKKSQIVRQYIKDGNKIRTNWAKNLINGFTQIDYYDKGKLRGIFNQGDLISGQITFPNNFVYTGMFSAFTFHGFGKLKFPSGQVFQGNWLGGYLQGKGKITYPKGQIYCGQISNFRRQGEGYLYFANGDKYVGEFNHGQITGFGELYKNGKVVHKGFWLNGKFFGQDYQKYHKQKLILNQAQRIKRASNISRTSILRQSMKQICQIHGIMNDSEQNEGLLSEAKDMDSSIDESAHVFPEEGQIKKSKLCRLNKHVSLSINFT